MDALKLRIELQQVEPMVWRRFMVPADIALSKLHKVIQIVMGWQDSHLHDFEFDGVRYGIPDHVYDTDMKNEKSVKLAAVLNHAHEFEYTYDFGDNWEHRIVVESISPIDPVLALPVCLAGENACPPDDVGGVSGYENFMEALSDCNHDSHEDLRRWIGGFFDPKGFDANAVNYRLARMRK